VPAFCLLAIFFHPLLDSSELLFRTMHWYTMVYTRERAVPNFGTDFFGRPSDWYGSFCAILAKRI
jgi:hypothetical protein